MGGLVTVSGYNVQNLARAGVPAPPAVERRLWYQYYLHGERGRAGLATHRAAFARTLWQEWSPTWAFGDGAFEATAPSFDNPDFVDVVVHSYRHRFGLVEGAPAYQATEDLIAAQPPITVPTLVIDPVDDPLATRWSPGVDGEHFPGCSVCGRWRPVTTCRRSAPGRWWRPFSKSGRAKAGARVRRPPCARGPAARRRRVSRRTMRPTSEVAGRTKARGAVTHVNHASLLLSHDDEYLLTDPWIVSPAFGSWVQHPAASADVVDDVLSLPPERLTVLVSHGHDDHLDDFVLRTHLASSRVVVPEYGNQALLKRVALAVDPRRISVVGDRPTSFGPFTVSRLVNEHFAGHDALVVVGTPSISVLHANDNWQVQSPATIESILALVDGTGPTVYLSQIGIADAFPWSYPQIDPMAASSVVRERIDRQCVAVAANARAIGVHDVYVYANESRIVRAPVASGLDTSVLTAERLAAHNASGDLGVQFHQLRSGAVIDPSGRLRLPAGPAGPTILDRSMQRLEDRCNRHMAQALGELGGGRARVRFAAAPSEGPDPSDGSDAPSVTYAADAACWQRILTGQLTMEAITIGGSGIIRTDPAGLSIQPIHHEMSRFAYLAQRGLLTQGLGWLDTQ